MLIDGPPQGKRFIKELTDTMLAVMVKYPSLFVMHFEISQDDKAAKHKLENTSLQLLP